jgi:hypothetical protein
MKMTILIIIAVSLLCLAIYYLLFPKNTFFTFYFNDKSRLVFSKTRIAYKPAPDSFSRDGINHISPYISKLFIPSTKFIFLLIFSPDGHRGLSLEAKDGEIKVGFTIDWRKQPEKENNIRNYFQNLHIETSKDYLGGNGGVPDAVRLLSYPLKGNEAEISSLVKDMLQTLCGISPQEALDIEYDE